VGTINAKDYHKSDCMRVCKRSKFISDEDCNEEAIEQKWIACSIATKIAMNSCMFDHDEEHDKQVKIVNSFLSDCDDNCNERKKYICKEAHISMATLNIINNQPCYLSDYERQVVI
jgi:hypothetical protein